MFGFISCCISSAIHSGVHSPVDRRSSVNVPTSMAMHMPSDEDTEEAEDAGDETNEVGVELFETETDCEQE